MEKVERHYWSLLTLVLLAYGAALFHGYVGEEANYTIMSMEMWQRQVFRSVVALGGIGGRPPLYNWIMIPVARLVGWPHVLLAARLVTLGATFATALVLACWARDLWRHPWAARLAFLFYLLSADVLFYRGWLAYADPLFSFFMVLSAYGLWRAATQRNRMWWMLSWVAVFASYLTKVVTSYAFYGGVLLVLLMRAEYRAFFLSRRALVVAMLGILPMVLWMMVVGRQDALQVHWQMSDITTKLMTVDSFPHYLEKLAMFPLTFWLGLLPSALWATVGMLWQWKRRGVLSQENRSLLGMALVNVLPYWIAPQSAVRYVLPEYGFIILLAVGSCVAPDGLPPWRLLRPWPWLGGFACLGILVGWGAFPYYQQQVRGRNYEPMADQVEAAAGTAPIYTMDFSSVGLSVVSVIDSRHMDRPPIVVPPSGFTEGVVLAYTPTDVKGERQIKIEEQAESFYLVCRGAPCAAPVFHRGGH